MKKTLIALAVLAASGATFAQVTVTGKLGFSYQKNPTTADAKGLRMSDGDINFSAKEDLGGGSSITANLAMYSRGRDTDISMGRDATLIAITPVGVISMGSAESANVLVTRVAGNSMISLANGFDYQKTSTLPYSALSVLDNPVNIDVIRYDVPVGPAMLGVAYQEINSVNTSSGDLATAIVGNAAYAAYAGTAGNGTGTSAWALIASYASGPITAYTDYAVFTSKAPAGATAAMIAGASATDGYTRFRVTGNYDLGVVKLGAGATLKNHGFANQYTVGAEVPMGAVTLALAYGTRAEQADNSAAFAAVTAAQARTGTAFAVKYDLSKTSEVRVSYAAYSGSGAGAAWNTYDSEYRIRLMKSF
jgi:hypothetical protein